MMALRNVVITGFGIVCSLGCSVRECWENLLRNRTAFVKLNKEQIGECSCRIGALVPHKFNSEISLSDQRILTRSAQLALVASMEAMSKCVNKSKIWRLGCCIGQGMPDLTDAEKSLRLMDAGKSSRLSPYTISRSMVNMPCTAVSKHFGIKGPNVSISTACASGLHAIGESFNLIRLDYADAMLCGGCESVINPITYAAFDRIRALARNFNDTPDLASRPFDCDRSGFVMAEGAGMLLLEEESHAIHRGAEIYARVLDFGLSGDAYHFTKPSGEGALSAMRSAMKNVDTDDVGFVSAHGSSTPVGDAIELKAIESAFCCDRRNRPLIVSSFKGALGHLLGASGAVELILTALCCQNGIILPTHNLKVHEPISSNIQLLKDHEIKWPDKKRLALKNAFGFGGFNASILLENYN